MTNKSISDAFARNKTHTVTAIAEAKEESNRYTDTQIVSAKSYSDTNLASAKTYTNESIANYEEVQSGVNVQLSNQISQVDNKVEQLNQSLGSAAHQESEYFTNYADGAAAGILSEANKHAEEYADEVKNSLLNGAGDAYDTLKELGELINDNTDAISALEVIATNKADKVHEHSITDITDADKKVNSPVDNNGNPIVGQKGYTLLAKGDGTTEWVYYPKIYIGSDEMPEGFDIKLDPNAPALELDATLSIDGAVADAGAVGEALEDKLDKNNPTGTGNFSMDGNAWFAGAVLVGGTSQSDAVELMRKDTITAGTSDLTAGSSSLATDTIYQVYS